MKFSNFIKEIYEPRSPDEARFIKKHKVQVFDYPVKQKDDPFTGSTKKDETLKASYKNDEDKEVYESKEAILELSTKTLQSYVKKSTESRAKHDRLGREADDRAMAKIHAGNPKFEKDVKDLRQANFSKEKRGEGLLRAKRALNSKFRGSQ